MVSNRDVSIDYLKAIASIGLISSHIVTNTFVLQLRSFDVNLLVIISAYLASSRLVDGYVGYIKKRAFRLIAPTWLFISFYLLINMMVRFQDYSCIQMIRSYLLLNNSIGYVWIIYVYCICALTVPVLIKLSSKKILSTIFIVIATVLYAVLVRMSDNYYYQIIVLYPIIYSLISMVGIIYRRTENNVKLWLFTSVVCLMVFTLIAVLLYKNNNQFVPTGEYKYPPRLYYLAYTIGISVILMMLRNKILFLDRIKAISIIVKNISSSSLWFYFWHILFMQTIALFQIKNELISLVIVLLFSYVAIVFQKHIIGLLENKFGKHMLFSILKG